MNTFFLSNPLSNPLLRPLALLELSMFALAALALQALHVWRVKLAGRHGAEQVSATPEQVLWRRYGTWALIALLFTSALLCGPLALALLCAFLCWQGGREYSLLTGLSAGQSAALILGGLATLLAVLLWRGQALLIAPPLAFFAWSLLALQPRRDEGEIGQRFNAGLAGLWGYLYLGWLPAYLLALGMSKRPGLVLVVGLGVALSDVGAFCAGRSLGGPQLAPRLSPNKTWSGLLGNLLGAALAVALTSFALPALQLWQYALLAAVIGLGSAWGDLLESLLKRQSGVKDAGALLPGFGGLLDRIDSLLIVAPLVYYVMLFVF